MTLERLHRADAGFGCPPPSGREGMGKPQQRPRGGVGGGSGGGSRALPVLEPCQGWSSARAGALPGLEPCQGWSPARAGALPGLEPCQAETPMGPLVRRVRFGTHGPSYVGCVGSAAALRWGSTTAPLEDTFGYVRSAAVLLGLNLRVGRPATSIDANNAN